MMQSYGYAQPRNENNMIGNNQLKSEEHSYEQLWKARKVS